MRFVVFENVRIVDPSRQLDSVGRVIISGDRIIAAGPDASNQILPETAIVFDLTGKAIFPGLIDSRVFIGEPGAEHRETIATASQAAAAGGITSFIMMPDTDPVIDSVSLVEFILRTAKETAKVNIYPSAALTRNQAGREITEFGLLKEAGAVALTEGKKYLAQSHVMRCAMTYARDFAIPIIHEIQEADLTAGGVMNAGLTASWLGLSGIPREAEVIALERDLRLAAATGVQYHAAQVSTALALDPIRRAKEAMDTVSAGVSISHLTLNENDIGDYRTFFRLSPPLRQEEDRQAMVAALREGLIDIIVSSHDPQDVDAKRLPFSDAKVGAVGMETLLSAALRLYHEGEVSLSQLIYALSTGPAKIFGLDAGTLKPGAKADLIIVDLEDAWILELDMLHSRCKNSNFEKARFQGRVLFTFVSGKIVYHFDEPHASKPIKDLSSTFKLSDIL